MRTFVEFWETPLDKAKYNWPWLKTCRGRYILRLGMICTCDLFMVIAKLSLTRNCFLVSTKGSPKLAFVFYLILGKNALFPALFSVMIFTSNIFLNKPRHNIHVPLHMPYLGSMFRYNIKGAPFFTFKICGGILPWEFEFRNSCPFISVMIGCFDSDYAGATDDRKSTSGYVILIGNGAISWSCKKQHIVTLSTTETML